MLFDESFEQAHARTGETIDHWRRERLLLWGRIKASPHYHGGRTCKEAGCDTVGKDP